MGVEGLKFLLIFLAILLILGTRGLLDTAKSRCKFSGKIQDNKVIVINQFLTT
jgi:hypothetical protein